MHSKTIKDTEIENPFFSVIIPVYNTENYLKECLDSIKNQTFKDIEVICIDDKSTDNSLEILEEYSKNDKRFKILKNTENMGQGTSRNRAIDESKGKYIALIDSDDKIDLNTFEEIYHFIKEYNQDIIIYDTLRFNHKGEMYRGKLQSKSIPKDKIPVTNILNYPNLIYDTAVNKIIKRSFLRENNLKFKNGRLYEDVLFSMELFLNTDTVGIYPYVKYYWRIREGENKSTTQKRTEIKNITDRVFIIKEMINKFETSEKYNVLIDDLYRKLLDVDLSIYINLIDKGNDEYKNIIKNEFIPIVEKINDDLIEELDESDKTKFKLLKQGDVDGLIKYIKSEKIKNLIKNPKSTCSKIIKKLKK